MDFLHALEWIRLSNHAVDVPAFDGDKIGKERSNAEYQTAPGGAQYGTDQAVRKC